MAWIKAQEGSPFNDKERKIELLTWAADSLQSREAEINGDMNNPLAMEIWTFLESIGVKAW